MSNRPETGPKSIGVGLRRFVRGFLAWFRPVWGPLWAPHRRFAGRILTSFRGLFAQPSGAGGDLTWTQGQILDFSFFGVLESFSLDNFR